MGTDRRRTEAHQIHGARNAGKQSTQRIDLDQVKINVDTGPPGRRGIRSDCVGVAAKPRSVEHDGGNHRDTIGNKDWRSNSYVMTGNVEPNELAKTNFGLHGRWDVRDGRAACQELAKS